MTGAINDGIRGITRATEACPAPDSIAQMPSGFFWTRTEALGFPTDFARQIDEGTLPSIYGDAVRQRVDAAAMYLDAAVSPGRPS